MERKNLLPMTWQEYEAVPIALTRIVVGLERYCIFVPRCPYCHAERLHDLFSFEESFIHNDDLFYDPLLAYHMHYGIRVAHCSPSPFPIPGSPPREAMPARTYRFVPGPQAACFTPLAANDPNSREAMRRLKGRGVPTSFDMLQL